MAAYSVSGGRYFVATWIINSSAASECAIKDVPAGGLIGGRTTGTYNYTTVIIEL